MKQTYMDRLITIIENLLKVKSIISLVTLCLFFKLSIDHYFTPDDIYKIILMVFTYYLGTQTGKASVTNNTVNNTTSSTLEEENNQVKSEEKKEKVIVNNVFTDKDLGGE